MKKTIIVAIILCMMLINTQSQATCWDDQPQSVNEVVCTINYGADEAERFYVPVNQALNIVEHCEWSGASGQTSEADATCEGSSDHVHLTSDASNTYPYLFGGHLTATYGTVDLEVSTQTGGYAYVEVTW